MIKTYNILLHPTTEIYNAWLTLLTEASNAYNTCANIIKTNNIQLSLKPVHNAVYNTLRELYPILPAQIIIKTYKDVISAFRSIKNNGKENTANTPYKNNPSIRLDKRLYSNLTKQGIYVSGVVKNKRQFIPFELYPQIEYMFMNYPTHDPSLFIKDNNLYISIPFECNELPVTGNHVTGVDLGIKRLFITSDGVAFRDKPYLKHRRQIRYLKSKLKSKGTKSARKHLRCLKHRERCISKDMLHRATNTLLRNCGDIIVLEGLKKIKEKTGKTSNGYKRVKHNNRFSQVPIAGFSEILSYKAPLYGKEVVTVNPSYTSQIDSRTGKKDGVRKGCRYYCIDGVVLDADWNAACNIAMRQKQHPYTNKITPIDGGIEFLCGTVMSTTQSYVNHE